MRARGLKQGTVLVSGEIVAVAPHAGAWIETSLPFARRQYPASRPMRARGLKPYKAIQRPGNTLSRPMRARGLKLVEHDKDVLQSMSRPMRARGLKR